MLDQYRTCCMPLQLYLLKLEVTQQCNSRCKTCNTWKIQDSTLSRSNSLDAPLQLDTQYQLISNAKTMGCHILELHGGEPTLYPHLANIIAYAEAKGIFTLLTTNGLSISASLANQIVKAGLKRINYSLDGPYRHQDEIRGVAGAFDKITDAMAQIRSADKTGRLITNINTMISVMNIDYLKEIVDVACENHINFMTFTYPSIYSQDCAYSANNAFRGKYVASWRLVGDEDYLVRDAQKIQQKRQEVWQYAKGKVRLIKTDFFSYPAEMIAKGIKRLPGMCQNIYANVTVDAMGNVYPCELLRYPLGNLNTNSVINLLASEAFHEFSADYSRVYRDLDICKYCVEQVYEAG